MKIQVLDHGYVELVECWGTGKEGADRWIERDHGEPVIAEDIDYEVGIIEAARQSTQGSFRGWTPHDCTCMNQKYPVSEWRTRAHEAGCQWRAGDKNLLKFLYNNHHSTPFEFAGMVLEVQAPIFVFREWHRHRTQSYNEMSARYAPLPDLYYMPTEAAVLHRTNAAVAEGNKQAGGAVSTPDTAIDAIEVEHWRKWVERLQRDCEDAYQFGLANGVPKELARLIMPVSHYSRMRSAANLRNWLSFVTLRSDSKAQWEIRQFSNAVGQLIAEKFPRTWKLFNDAQSKAKF